ncbi:MAG TPA: PD-(D/E)XK nuclease family protein [Candidatus Paceibacterota bacterium]|nr:PD-(D/E)XK nuclease family protein [Candidatus Paceibacterota bacterium]
MQDKYTATWVSHSSMGDFLKCPRLYYLHNIYKDPKTGNKISLVSPYMSLGVAVHEVLESLCEHKAEDRLKQDLRKKFEEAWKKVSGEKGGFKSKEEEEEFKKRGLNMIENVIKDPKFLGNKALKLPREKMNPNFFLSDEHNIILNGLVDWIEYLPETDSLHIIDFKTGKNEESENSLQLPIYLLLCDALQKRKVTKASYWYLESGKFIEKELPNLEEAKKAVMETALKVKQARDKKEFKCPKGEAGCFSCRPYEAILKGEAKYLGTGGFNQDLYML